MASCFTDAEPINPINQLLVDLFGQNYFPPYSASGQPVKQKDMTDDKLLQWSFPGGGKGKPPGLPQLSNIADLIAPMTSMLSQIFTFLGPLFIIIDIIRLIIDVICALLNPVPLIAAVIALILGLLPLIALFPAFAMVLMAINLCKLIVSIIASMLSILIPLIELIIRNALSIADLLAPPNFNISAVDAVSLKICTLLQHLDNQIGAFTPLAFILEIFALFASLASIMPCAPGSACCDTNTCPPFVINPPAGSCSVSRVQEQLTLVGIINMILSPIDATLSPLSSPPQLNPLEEGFPGGLGLPIDISVDLGGADIEIIPPETDIRISSPATSTANPFGLLSSKGVGGTYTVNEIYDGKKYIVDPAKIPLAGTPQSGNNAATPFSLAIKMGNKTGRIKKMVRDGNDVIITIDRDDMTGSSYTIVPDMSALMTLNMIGIGCVSEVAAQSQALINQINADVAATGQTSNNGTPVSGTSPAISGLSSFRDKVGSDVPTPPTDELAAIADKINQDPTTDISEEIKDLLLDYLDQVTDYYDNVLCIGASRLKTDFSVDKTILIGDGYDSATLSLTVKELGGGTLLNGLLPSSSAKVEFYSTKGTIGPAVLDDLTGTYRATFTSTETGEAEISAAFLINDKACMTPGSFDGFNVTDKILRVKIIPIEESFARRRPANQYVQSGRGKRR